MEYLIIGEIINTHGIKGELRIHPLTNDIKRFKDLNYVYLGEEKKKVKVSKTREHKNIIIIKFEEYDNINEVLKYKGQYIYIDFEERRELEEDHYYIYELIGLDVFNTEEEAIGSLIDVIQGARNDVYLIEGINGKESMVPAVKEFIKDIDLDNKKMIIDPIEGMIQ